MLRCLPLLIGVMLCSCVHERSVRLADLRSHRMTVKVNAEGTDVEVWLLRWIPGGGVEDFEEPCPVLDERVSATLDGAPMRATGRGGYTPSEGGDLWTSSPAFCKRPMFRIATSKSTAATSEVRITDGRTTFRTVVRALHAERRFVMTDAFLPGADVRLVWSVPSDVRPPPAPYLEADWSPERGRGFHVWLPYGSAAARSDGSTVVLPVPADAQIGPGKLFVKAGFEPSIAACEGIAHCDAGLTGGLPVARPRSHVSTPPVATRLPSPNVPVRPPGPVRGTAR